MHGGSGSLHGGSGVFYIKEFGEYATIYLTNNGGDAADTEINEDLSLAEMYVSNYANAILNGEVNTDVLSFKIYSDVTIGSGSTTTLTNEKLLESDGTGNLIVNGHLDATISELSKYSLEVGNGGIVNTTVMTVEENMSLRVLSGGSFSNGTIDSLTSSGTLFFEGNSNFSIGNFTMNTGTLTMHGYTTDTQLDVTNFTMNAGSSVTHPDNSANQTHIINIRASDNIRINTNATIDVEGLGYDGGLYPSDGKGPTGGFGKYGGSQTHGGGGAHCGDGGTAGGAGGTAYGNISNLSTMGAGGGSPYVTNRYGGNGGGLIILTTSGTLHIDGSLLASGTDGDDFGTYDGGGGAGGGIKLVADTLSGSPSALEAMGGGGAAFGGGGGGGCIQAVFSNRTFNTSTLSVSGGVGGEDGDVGAVSFSQINTPPTAVLGLPIQTNARLVTVTSTITDAGNTISSLHVEYSLDEILWNDVTLGLVTPSEGSITTSSGQVSGIDTNIDGIVDLTIEWNIAADVPDTNDSTVYLRVTPNDGTENGDTVTSTAFTVDTADPTTPGNLVISDSSASSVRLAFPNVTSSDANFDTYRIYYSTSTPVTSGDTAWDSGDDVNLGDAAFSGATSTNITGLSPNATYYFNLFAFDSFGHSTSSVSEVSTTTLAETPTGLVFVSYATSSITAVWNTGGTNNPAGTVYEVYNFTSSTSFGTTTDTNLPLAGLTPGHEYSVGVRAQNSSGVYTAYDTSFFATLPATPQTPSNTVISSSTINVSLNANVNGNTTTFAIYDVIEGVWIDDAGTTTSSPVYQAFSSWGGTAAVSGLSANTQHSYIVRARGAYAAYASSSASTPVYTFAAVPCTPTFSSITANSMTIAWASSTNPTGTVYELRLADDTLIATTTDTNYTHTSLDSNTSYTYKVRAINGDDVYTVYSPSASQSTTSNVPIATIGTASQTSAGIVTVTSTVSDTDSDATTLAVEYSTDGSTWHNATLGTVTDTEGQGGVTTSTGQISGIDTNNDGSVDLTIEWNVAADISGTDDSTVYLRVTPNDGTTDGASATSVAFAVDAQAPIITDNGTLTISTNNGAEEVAGIGDGLTLTGVTTTIDDGHVITIDFGTVGGDNDVLMGVEGFVGVGEVDGMTTFTIRVTDDIGNVSVTTSEAISVDNQAPTFAGNGTLTITTDNGTEGIAGIGDGITLTGATTTVADSDVIVIDYSPAGGFVGVAMGAEGVVTAGNLDATSAFVITATDNAGNTATTTSDSLSIDNIAPTATTGGIITIVDDVSGNDIAAIGDKVRYTEGDLENPDTTTWTIDLSGLTGQAALAAGVTSTVITTGTLDSATQTFTVTLTDDAGNTATTTSGVLSVDNKAPVVAANGTMTITTDNGVEGVAGVGDGLTLSGVTVTENDTDVVTIYYGPVGGNDATLMGAEGYVGTGSVDGNISFVIYVTDNAGNTVTTTSDVVNVDNQAPTFADNGTISISTDNGTEGVAGIEDGLTLSGATTTVDDGDVIVIDYSPAGGFVGVAMDTEGVVTAGDIDATTTFVITATDNAGNTVTTTSDGISIDNVAPTAATGGTITIVDDVGSNGVAAIGDKVRFTEGVLDEPDTVTWTIDLSNLTGQAALAAGVTSSVVTAGSLDSATQTFVVTLTDDAGNTATTTSGSVSVDNTAPVISANGTMTITTDNGVGGVAGIGDGLTLSGVTVAESDSDVITVYYGTVGGNDGTLMGVEGFIGTGSVDGNISFIIYVTDNAGNTVTTTSDVVNVDNQAPTFADNGTISISTDNGTEGIAGIGDGITLTGATTTVADSDVIVIDYSSAGGFVGVAMGAEGVVTAGSLDATTTFVITATDNAGNTVTTTSDGISIDNVAPAAATAGSITISYDADSNGVAAIGDRITYHEGTLDSPDTVTWTINVESLTGQTALAAGTTSSPIVAGNIDTATQTFTVTLTDDAGNTGTVTSGIVSVDNEAPVVTDNGTISITTDNGTEGVAGIGDGLTLSGVTTQVADDDIVTIDFGVAGGVDQKLMGQEDFLSAGAVDTAMTLTITVIDDGGNSITTTSDLISVDINPPTILSNGTFTITTDLDANGVANIGDGVTLAGVTIASADTDTVTINLNDISGNSSVAIDTESTIIAGAVSSSAYTATITVTDDAGNTATTSSDRIAVQNIEDNDGEEDESEENDLPTSGGGTSIPPSITTIESDVDDTMAFSLNYDGATTHSRMVEAIFRGVTNASQVALSNSTDFSGVSFIPFANTLNHLLSAGNGLKTVYAKLRSHDGGTITLFDTIQLIGQQNFQEETVACSLPMDTAYKVADDSTIYYVTRDCTRRVISSPERYFSYFESWDEVQTVSLDEINGIPADTISRGVPWGPRYNPASGTLVKTFTRAEVYLLLDGTLYYIADEQAAAYHFGSVWASWIIDVDPRLIANYPFTADTLIDTGIRPNGILLKYEADPTKTALENAKIYRLEADPTNQAEQVIRHIADTPTFLSLNFRDDRIVTIPRSELYTEGNPITNTN